MKELLQRIIDDYSLTIMEIKLNMDLELAKKNLSFYNMSGGVCYYVAALPDFSEELNREFEYLATIKSKTNRNGESKGIICYWAKIPRYAENLWELIELLQVRVDICKELLNELE